MKWIENKYIRKSMIIVGWLLVWQAASLYVGNSILLVGPVKTLTALAENVRSLVFWQAVAVSVIRILGGFLLAFAGGILLGALSSCSSLAEEIMEPVFLLMKTVPVASVTILLLIWTSSRYLSTAVSFMVVLPMIYFSVRTGIRETDGRLLEMADVFRLGFLKKLWHLYRPAVMPYLISSCRTALGMSWKSGVAAEVIGVPSDTIGERLYMAKIYLETGDLFAWTLVILLISLITEKLFLGFLHLIYNSGKG